MVYATVAAVEALTQRGRYSATTRPTDVQVSGFLDSVAAEIDSVLAAQGVSTPITAPATFLAHVLHMNAVGAAELAEAAMFQESVGVGSSGTVNVFGARYRRMLDNLVKGSSIPPVAGTAGARVQAASYGTNNPNPITGLPPAPLFAVDTPF